MVLLGVGEKRKFEMISLDKGLFEWEDGLGKGGFWDWATGVNVFEMNFRKFLFVIIYLLGFSFTCPISHLFSFVI